MHRLPRPFPQGATPCIAHTAFIGVRVRDQIFVVHAWSVCRALLRPLLLWDNNDSCFEPRTNARTEGRLQFLPGGLGGLLEAARDSRRCETF